MAPVTSKFFITHIQIRYQSRLLQEVQLKDRMPPGEQLIAMNTVMATRSSNGTDEDTNNAKMPKETGTNE